jgi:hypothetical protein
VRLVNAHGSSTDTPRGTGAGRDLTATPFTILDVAEVHPGRMQGRASRTGLLLIYGTSCSHRVHLSRDSAPRVEVCPLARGMRLPRGSTPLRPMTDRPSLVPRSSPRTPLGSPCRALSQPPARLGERQASHVPRASPCGVGLASPPVAQHLPQVREAHLNLATCLWAHASQPLSLVRGDDVYRRFTSVDPRTPSWSPTPWMRVVATASHDEVAIREG